MYRSAGLVRPIEILLVEDNPADVRLVIEGLKSTQMTHHLHTAADGEEAIEFVRQRGQYKLLPRPDLILLDLNLPRKSGHEVLADIKADPRTRRIPVIVLTSSKDRNDVEKVYDLNANSYIQKPTDLDSMFQMLGAIELFWLKWAVLPTPAA
jgi:two-component system, chemotaxis family, response regulator Rcp1